MKPRKKVKKLVLNKEEIVNLNDNQMNSLKGGGSIGISIAVTSIVYETGKDTSLWLCPPLNPDPTPTPPPKQPSDVWEWIGDEQVCRISEAVVYGIDTSV